MPLKALLLAVPLVFSVGTAFAQQTAAPDTPPDKGARTQSQSDDQSDHRQNLTEKLDKNGGVINPAPTGDPSVLTPPNQGVAKTPVIKPPGSPGDQSDVKPK